MLSEYFGFCIIDRNLFFAVTRRCSYTHFRITVQILFYACFCYDHLRYLWKWNIPEADELEAGVLPLKLSASAMVPREVNYLTKIFLSVGSVIKMFQSRACSANTPIL
jgi:hypothetical protein